VSAVIDGEPGTIPKTSGPKPPGTTALKALKGTAKMDPVDIPVAINAASTIVPTTQPSAGGSIALDQTMRADVSEIPAPEPKKEPTPPPGGQAPVDAAPIDATLPLDISVEEPAAPEPAAASAAKPAAPVVWEPPQRKRLSGPVAMGLGILIGAILFGLTLLILHGRL
jgi:hypothetical protein